MPSQAQIERDNGIARAADHADRVSPTWTDRAAALLVQYTLTLPVGECITSEGVREYAELQGLPPPPDLRTWGAVMVRAAKAGHIKRVGYVNAKNPKVHCTVVSLWEVV